LWFQITQLPNYPITKFSDLLIRVHPRQSAVSIDFFLRTPMKLFAQLSKIDEARHEVWGVATAEVVDKEGEIFDYESSKPFFQSWSDEIAKATDGKSLGNVR